MRPPYAGIPGAMRARLNVCSVSTASLASYLVSVIAAGLGGHILNGILIGGSCILIALICALLLPETAGRRFAVIEAKTRDLGNANAPLLLQTWKPDR